MTALRDEYDGLLLDLDGTLYRGRDAVPHAVESIRNAPKTRPLYITNNASRSASDVAEHLSELGFPVCPADVVTSAQAAAALVAELVPAGARVLVVGTEALAAEITDAGLKPVREVTDAPEAVVQGHSPYTDWSVLAEAALAIRAGAVWVAANLDATLPTERGLLPGNGSMVAALRTATDRTPHVAGKPGAQIFHSAVTRAGLSAPLVVGDRLDTDIAGAHAAGLPSLYVMTGVSQPLDVLLAAPAQRPDFLAEDLRCLAQSAAELRPRPQADWKVTRTLTTVTVEALANTACEIGALRAIAAEVWIQAEPDWKKLVIRGTAAHHVLQTWPGHVGVSRGEGASPSVSVEFDD